MDVNVGEGTIQPTKATISPKKASLMHPHSTLPQAGPQWHGPILLSPLVIRGISWTIAISFTAIAMGPGIQKPLSKRVLN